tara:strand:+ start:855 stop:1049 length:195 start_codon:yes stop_codon:yes gene_type:complete
MKQWILIQTLKRAIGSRKFLYTAIGCIATLLSDSLGLDAAEVKNILFSIAALVLGQGIADVAKK